jgi:murein DD-endopeptidase MepM/ murein hydrolase activator NlpD
MSVRRRFFCLLFLMAVFSIFGDEVVHIIQRGETIYTIARNYGVNFQEILTLNGIQDARKIQAGQRIRIPRENAASPVPALTPVPAAAAPGAAITYIEYRVARGEAFYGISRRFGTTVEAIRAANSLKEDYVLKEGDMLRIPQAAPSGAASGTAALAAPAAAQGTAPATGAVKAGPAAAAGGAAAASRDAAPRQTAPGKMDASVRWPVSAKELSYMTGKLYGVVLLGEQSEPVKSLTTGTVVSAGPYRGFGRVAIVQMTGGYLYVYGGCENLSVKEGDKVMPGTELGRLGVDAVSAKPQLFFLVYRNNNPIDPAKAPRA